MLHYYFVFFFKQKTAYEMRISDWSSDVCSSDLPPGSSPPVTSTWRQPSAHSAAAALLRSVACGTRRRASAAFGVSRSIRGNNSARSAATVAFAARSVPPPARNTGSQRSEEHTSELQSLMRISYAVFCLKQKRKTINK